MALNSGAIQLSEPGASPSPQLQPGNCISALRDDPKKRPWSPSTRPKAPAGEAEPGVPSLRASGTHLGPWVPRPSGSCAELPWAPPLLLASPGPHPGAGRLERGRGGGRVRARPLLRAAWRSEAAGACAPRPRRRLSSGTWPAAQRQRPRRGGGRPAHRGSRPTPPAPPAHAESSIIIIKESLRTCLH